MKLKCRDLRSRFCTNKTHSLLNYCTLQISDPEITRMFQANQYLNFRRLSPPLLIFLIFLLFSQLVSTFVLDWGSHIELILTAYNLLCLASLQSLPKCTERFLFLIVSSSLLVHSIAVNLAYRDLVIESLKCKNKANLDYILIVNYVVTTSINQSSVRFATFVMFPIFVIATYF